jgi:hypothetical protein
MAVPTTNVTLQISLKVTPKRNTKETSFSISLQVKPKITVFEKGKAVVPVVVKIIPIEVPLTEAVKSITSQIFSTQINNFFDQDRQGKNIIEFWK